ncbi:MAG: hypothetical protein NT039_01890 [Candidatus Berkelbacteria bacterium]|nr:hypothetical protein [Candidatus Berkelbacteria bacterium]
MMISLIGPAVWIVLLMACTVCLTWATETADQKKERVLSCIGLVTGLVAFWMLIFIILTDTHSILGGVFWLGVALGGTLFLVRVIARAMMTGRTTQQEGR